MTLVLRACSAALFRQSFIKVPVDAEGVPRLRQAVCIQGPVRRGDHLLAQSTSFSPRRQVLRARGMWQESSHCCTESNRDQKVHLDRVRSTSPSQSELRESPSQTGLRDVDIGAFIYNYLYTIFGAPFCNYSTMGSQSLSGPYTDPYRNLIKGTLIIRL